eukprot:TRINITY_DN704_c0_g1_i2.p1 TRINITY_DN704_c0_g1~~TRINITY_DN704_c0_g1_i2.p1  ORF type:complete len:304 (-),score=97.49 TRINITY_DN704_c0_g1_i2:407-1318(-)
MFRSKSLLNLINLNSKKNYSAITFKQNFIFNYTKTKLIKLTNDFTRSMYFRKNEPINEREISNRKKSEYTSELLSEIVFSNDTIPIVYSDRYNITAYGCEKLHPFDSQKYRRVFRQLESKGLIDKRRIVKPRSPTKEELLLVHTPEYLHRLEDSKRVASILEFPFAACLPISWIKYLILTPMLVATGGTMIAAQLALKYGWSINLGGGYHHASANLGSGFCVYADITLAIKKLRLTRPNLKVFIIDLDAHQGNGPERDFKGDKNICIMDMYSYPNYPDDAYANTAIDVNIRLMAGTEDEVLIN